MNLTRNLDRSGGNLGAIAGISIAAVLLAFPLLRSSFLPFVDLPQHLALAQLLRSSTDPDISGLYEVSLLPQVNVLGLMALASSLTVLPETAAVNLVLLLYIVGLAWALYRLAGALGTSRWTAVVALLFSVNFNLWYGFVSFCLGIPIMIFIVARLAEPDLPLRPRTFLVDAALWFVLILAHSLLFAFCMAASLLWAVLATYPRHERVYRLLPVIPATLWLLAWLMFGGPGFSTARGSAVEFEWHSAGTKLAGSGWSMIVAGVKGSLEWLVLGAAGLLIVILLIREFGGLRTQDSRQHSHDGRRLIRMRLWVRLVALMALLLYSFLPFAITSSQFVTRGIFLLYNRFLILAPLLLVPTLVWPRSLAVRRLLALAALALHVALAWHMSDLMRRVSLEAEGLDGAIAAMEPAKTVKSLIYTPYPGAIDFPSFLHVASYYQARRLGEVDQSFALLPATPVHYRDPQRPYLSHHDEHLVPHLFDWDQALMYDYVLLYDRGGDWKRFYVSAPFRRIYGRNGWIVLDVKGDRMRRNPR